MKYFVVANQKWIVSVDANSAGAAEHAVLDVVDGIQYAQAFTGKELSTDTFQHFFENGTTVTIDELLNISAEYTEAVKKCKACAEQFAERKKEVDRLKAELEVAEHNLNISNWNAKQAKLEMISARTRINFQNS